MKREGKGRGKGSEWTFTWKWKGKGNRRERGVRCYGDWGWGGVGKIGIENKRYYERGRLASRGMGKRRKNDLT